METGKLWNQDKWKQCERSYETHKDEKKSTRGATNLQALAQGHTSWRHGRRKTHARNHASWMELDCYLKLPTPDAVLQSNIRTCTRHVCLSVSPPILLQWIWSWTMWLCSLLLSSFVAFLSLSILLTSLGTGIALDFVAKTWMQHAGLLVAVLV